MRAMVKGKAGFRILYQSVLVRIFAVFPFHHQTLKIALLHQFEKFERPAST